MKAKCIRKATSYLAIHHVHSRNNLAEQTSVFKLELLIRCVVGVLDRSSSSPGKPHCPSMRANKV